MSGVTAGLLITALGALVGAILGATIAPLITARSTAVREQRTRDEDRLLLVLERLGALRAKYRRHAAEAHRYDDFEMDEAKDALTMAAASCLDDDVRTAVERYVVVGDRYAARDERWTYTDEGKACDVVINAVTAARKVLRRHR